jgi:hypothetical protein
MMNNQTKYLVFFLIIINISFIADIKRVDGNQQLSNGTDSWEIVWDPGVAAAAFGIALDSEENIFVCGVIAGGDLLLVKFNSSGNYLWNRTWDYPTSVIGKSIGLDSSDNIYIAVDAVNDYELLLVKFDKFGNYQWNVSSGISSVVEIYRLLIDQSGNIYIVGMQNVGVGIFVAKFNNVGVKQWEYIYSSSDFSHADFSLDSSNDILVVANADGEVNLFKLDNSGSFLWDILLDIELSPEFTEYILHGMTLDSADNIYLAGIVGLARYGNYGNFLLVKCNSTGQPQWFRTQGKYNRAFATSNHVSLSNIISLNSLDNIYFAGETYTVGYETDIVLLKYDNTGEFQGQREWGIDDRDEYASGIAIDSLDNVYLVGSTSEYDIILFKNLGISKSSDLGITGFDIIITFAISSIISIFLVYKQKKRNNKYN